MDRFINVARGYKSLQEVVRVCLKNPHHDYMVASFLLLKGLICKMNDFVIHLLFTLSFTSELDLEFCQVLKFQVTR